MNQTSRKLSAVPASKIRTLPKGVATHRSIVIRGKIIWAWKPLSSAIRIQVARATRAVYFNAEHLDRILEQRTLNAHAKPRKRG